MDSSLISVLLVIGFIFEWGLRILAVHVDDGFDTEISKRNIERIANFPNLDLKIIKPDTEQFNELPWSLMAKMRDKLIHWYFEVDEEIVYNVVKDKLPTIKTQIDEIIKTCK